MVSRISCIAALLLSLVLPAQAQTSSPTTSAAEAQKRQAALVAQQSQERLQQTRKNLDEAIAQLQRGRQAPEPTPSTPAQTGVAAQNNAIQQAEQALLDVRRAIDELEVPQQQRQEVLDRLDDADSALRMARRPDAEQERQRLQQALLDVQKEVEQAQQALPDPPPASAK
jgi:hypothetical protein